jgi:hypothetical protein
MISDAPLRGAMTGYFRAAPGERPKSKEWRGPQGRPKSSTSELQPPASRLSAYFAAFCSASTLSVFSQLNSGRPKWP